MRNLCDNCGLCCMHMASPPFCGPDDPEWIALPADLKAGIEQWYESPRMKMRDVMRMDSFPCVWLDLTTGKCRHYEHRPEVCREFEMGGEDCEATRGMVGLTINGTPPPSGAAAKEQHDGE
jgi:Fe-S-cluster containining protein